ncbi:hypothetical protein BGM09_25380 [Streptomyces sp. CBMA29]|nr:hypothetical protein [Streptomyces sp. CBMA29]
MRFVRSCGKRGLDGLADRSLIGQQAGDGLGGVEQVVTVALVPSQGLPVLRCLPFIQQWHRYLTFDAATFLGWDVGRAVTNCVAILLAGPAALTTFRRANFTGPVRFVSPTAL